MAKKNENTEEVVEPKVDAPVEPTEGEKTEPKEPEVAKEKSVKELADEVDRGVYGSGRERMIQLGARYEEVQKEVNRRFIEKNRIK